MPPKTILLIGTLDTKGREYAYVRDLIAARGRYRGVRAPGWGLTLAAVRYAPGVLPPERLAG